MSGWYLRTQDDTFGPETRDRLIEWARMGRIQPGQEISEDGENWVPATEVSFLDMRWSIDIGDGVARGPFNKAAAQALLASGRLPKSARLVPPPEAESPSPAPAPAQTYAENSIREPSPAPSTAHAGTPPPPDPRLQEALKKARDEARQAQEGIRRAQQEFQRVQEEARQAQEETRRAQEDARRVREDSAHELETLRAGLKAAEQRAADAEKAASDAQAATKTAQKAADLAEARMAALDAEIRAAHKATEEAQAQARNSHAEAQAAQKAAQEATAQAKGMADKAKAELAELTTANKVQENAYEERIQSLSDELNRLPSSARLAADAQAAVYAIMKEEAEELAASLEAETREIEALVHARRERSARLLARRQEILRRIGTDADDMTDRALKAHPEDPRTVHLREELDALRLLQERAALESDRKVRDLSARLHEKESENKRLLQQQADVTLLYRQLQETRERLQRRERELMDERQKGEAARQQSASTEQTLLARISALEMGLPGTTHQSREARNVKLAPWMGLKK